MKMIMKSFMYSTIPKHLTAIIIFLIFSNNFFVNVSGKFQPSGQLSNLSLPIASKQSNLSLPIASKKNLVSLPIASKQNLSLPIGSRKRVDSDEATGTKSSASRTSDEISTAFCSESRGGFSEFSLSHGDMTASATKSTTYTTVTPNMNIMLPDHDGPPLQLRLPLPPRTGSSSTTTRKFCEESMDKFKDLGESPSTEAERSPSDDDDEDVDTTTRPFIADSDSMSSRFFLKFHDEVSESERISSDKLFNYRIGGTTTSSVSEDEFDQILPSEQHETNVVKSKSPKFTGRESIKSELSIPAIISKTSTTTKTDHIDTTVTSSAQTVTSVSEESEGSEDESKSSSNLFPPSTSHFYVLSQYDPKDIRDLLTEGFASRYGCGDFAKTAADLDRIMAISSSEDNIGSKLKEGSGPTGLSTTVQWATSVKPTSRVTGSTESDSDNDSDSDNEFSDSEDASQELITPLYYDRPSHRSTRPYMTTGIILNHLTTAKTGLQFPCAVYEAGNTQGKFLNCRMRKGTGSIFPSKYFEAGKTGMIKNYRSQGVEFHTNVAKWDSKLKRNFRHGSVERFARNLWYRKGLILKSRSSKRQESSNTLSMSNFSFFGSMSGRLNKKYEQSTTNEAIACQLESKSSESTDDSVIAGIFLNVRHDGKFFLNGAGTNNVIQEQVEDLLQILHNYPKLKLYVRDTRLTGLGHLRVTSNEDGRQFLESFLSMIMKPTDTVSVESNISFSKEFVDSRFPTLYNGEF